MEVQDAVRLIATGEEGIVFRIIEDDPKGKPIKVELNLNTDDYRADGFTAEELEII